MEINISKNQAIGLSLAVILVILKTWLVSDLVPLLIANAAFDDALFARLATSIADGEWLGTMDHLTHAKGSFFPIWLALVSKTGISIVVANNLAYALSAALFSLFAIGKNAPIRALLAFAFLLFFPSSYTFQLLRITRDYLYGVETLLVITGIVAVLKPSSTWKSYLFLGAMLGPFWITREEGIWIVPSIIALFCLKSFPTIKTRNWGTIKPIALGLVIVLTIPTLMGQVVRHLNKKNYGVAVATEFQASYFNKAMGALQSVKHENRRQFIHVPKDVREKIYQVSPAFRELKPLLEKRLTGWYGPGCRYIDPCDDYSSHFVWAFRDAVQWIGYYSGLQSARAYYRRLSTEIFTACDDGRLDCYKKHTSVRPLLFADDIPRIANSFWSEVSYVFNLDGIRPRWLAPQGSPEQIARMATLTNIDSNTLENLSQHKSNELVNFKFSILSGLSEIYRHLTLILFIAAMVVQIFLIKKNGWNRTNMFIAILGVALTCRFGILSVIHSTAFEAINVIYNAPSYILLAAIIAISLSSLRRKTTARLT